VIVSDQNIHGPTFAALRNDFFFIFHSIRGKLPLQRRDALSAEQINAAAVRICLISNSTKTKLCCTEAEAAACARQAAAW